MTSRKPNPSATPAERRLWGTRFSHWVTDWEFREYAYHL
jgi:hypothetical protein